MNSKEIILPEVAASVKLAATYHLEARKADGSVARQSATFHNLITDYGLNALAKIGCRSLYSGKCYVGTGSATPQFTDTALTTPLANTPSFSSTSDVAATGPTWAQTTIVTATFALGSAVGNIAEVGFGDTAGLFSHALVADAQGAPTVFPVLSDEQLVVVYQLTQYPPLVDGSGSISINGTNYTYTSRAYWVHINSNTWHFAGSSSNSIPYYLFSMGGSRDDQQADLVPLGVSGNQNPGFGFTITKDAYVDGSYKVSGKGTCVPAGGAGNLRIVEVGFFSSRFQVKYVPDIVKTNTQTLVLPFSFTWARA